MRIDGAPTIGPVLALEAARFGMTDLGCNFRDGTNTARPQVEFGPAGSPQTFFPTANDVLTLVGDGVISTDAGGQILLFNRAAEEMFGIAAADVLGRPVGMLVPRRFQAGHGEEVRRFAESASTGSRQMGERRVVFGRRANGEEFPLEATLSRSLVDGIAILTVVVRDVTERKNAEEQAGLIASELNHRMKNLLALVNAIVSMSGGREDTVAEYKQSLLLRLGSLAEAHRLLVDSQWAGTTVDALIHAELVAYGYPDCAAIMTTGPQIMLDPGAGIALGLVIHELGTNAAKYGALSTAGGRIELAWRLAAIGTRERMILEWSEHDGPPVAPPAHRGFGSILIERMLRLRGAKVKMDFRPSGLHCRIDMPVSDG